MTVEYGFDKHKLPKGFSFPLKRSVLDQAIEQAGLTRLHVVYYWLRQSGDIVLRACHCGEGRRAFAAGMSSITVYAVLSSERQATEDAILNQGLPKMMAWLQSLERAGNTRRGVDQHFTAAYAQGVMTVESI